MADQDRRVIVDGVDFRELFVFPRIFSSVFAALQPARMIIALFMVLLLVSIGRLWDSIVEGDPFSEALTLAGRGFATMTGGVLSLSLAQILEGVGILLWGIPQYLWENHTFFSIIYGLLFVLIMAVGGGALSRMAAIQTATHQRVPIRRALQFAFTRWVRLFIAPLMPLLAAIVVGLIIVVMGLLMLVPVLNIIGGLLYIIVLALALLIAFLLLVYAPAFLMVVPAMAAEDCDGADGQQRAFGYVLSKPLHMAGYLLIALIGLALGFFVVSLFATTALNLAPELYGMFWEENPALAPTAAVTAFGAMPVTAEQADANWHQVTAGWLINLWQTLIISLVWAYVLSYFFSAATTVYLLMRRACDGQDIEEIWDASPSA